MKILHIINTLGKGGAEKLLVQTLPYYNRQPGWEVALLQITSQHAVPGYLDTLNASGMAIHTLGNKSVYDPSNILLLRKFLKSRKYDIIHVHIFPAMYWVPLAFASNNARLIFTEHNTRNRRWDKWYFKGLDKYIYHKYQAIVAITDDVRKNLAAWQPGIQNRIVTIFNGIDIAKLNEVKSADRAGLLASSALPVDAVLLMMTARFDKQKNHGCLIHAMSHLPGNYALLLAGEGPEKAAMEQLAADQGVAGKVRFLGFRTDVLNLMKTVDLNVLSSNYEGLSGVTLESLCSGKPFLGADVSGIQNVVPDGRFLFENNNPVDLAAKISQVITDTAMAAAMARAALEYVQAY
ncbi:MAG: glycosyltransferase, partial [Sphingobacteriales bacterium]